MKDFLCLFFTLLSTLFSLFLRKARSTERPCQPAAAYLFIKSVNLSFMSGFKSDLIQDASSWLMESQGCCFFT